jgi:hypothetical protein
MEIEEIRVGCEREENEENSCEGDISPELVLDKLAEVGE